MTHKTTTAIAYLFFRCTPCKNCTGFCEMFIKFHCSRKYSQVLAGSGK